jgi:hypothetical protein
MIQHGPNETNKFLMLRSPSVLSDHPLPSMGLNSYYICALYLALSLRPIQHLSERTCEIQRMGTASDAVRFT